MVRDIAKALCEYQRNKNNKKEGHIGFESKEFNQKFSINPNDIILIEDLLKIYVDDPECSIELVEYIVNNLVQNYHFDKEIEQLSEINLYHRCLEYKLYNKKMKDLSKEYEVTKDTQEQDMKEFYKEI